MGSAVPMYDVAALYRDHKDAMYAIATQILGGDWARAEDVVMTVMEELLKKPPTERIDNPQGYMVTRAKRRALDELKRSDNKTVSLPAGYDITDTASNVEDDVVEWLDQRSQAQEFLTGLDSQAWYVAVHYIAGGESRREVADHLGVSGSRISQIASQALARMRQVAQTEQEVM